MSKSDFTKIVNCYVEDTFKRITKQATGQKKIFAKQCPLLKGLVFKIHEELKLSRTKQATQLKIVKRRHLTK